MRSRKEQRGFTLTEVLVSVIVLSIGLLGLASLQANSLKFNHSAYTRSQATHLVYSITDQMRANRQAALNGDYDVDRATTPGGSTVAAQTVAAWKADVANRLPAGEASICRSNDGQACDGAGNVFIVDVFWDDSRGEEPEQQFRFVTAL
jgi:type IV pilus assembly protein PilV